MSDFRRWKGETLEPDWMASFRRIIFTLVLWLAGSLGAVVMVLLLLMYV